MALVVDLRPDSPQPLTPPNPLHPLYMQNQATRDLGEDVDKEETVADTVTMKASCPVMELHTAF